MELRQGTLDLLIARTLLLGPAHGHAIARISTPAAGEGKS